MTTRPTLVLLALGLALSACGTSSSSDAGDTGPAPTEVTEVTDAGPLQITIGVEDDAVAVVGDSPPGTHFTFAPGLHRGVVLTPRDGDVFVGEEGAVLSGAVVVEGFVETDGVWRAPVADVPDEPFGQCRADRPMCGANEELFVDGEAIRRVETLDEVAADSWWFDPAGVVVVGDDPGERLVELSTAPWAIRGVAVDVTISDLHLRHYANQAGIGVLHVEEQASGWRIEDCEVLDSHGVGVVARNGSTVEGCWIEGIGQQGIGGGGPDLVVERNVLIGNNRLGFDPAWSAGGAKFAFTTDLVVRRNVVLANDGAGLWTDIDNVDTLHADNWVQGNTGAGIFHEISYAALIAGNTVLDNGGGAEGWIWGGGIQVAGSADVTVTDNLVVGNRHAIVGVDQQRGAGQFGEYRLRNLTVTDNVIRDSGQTGIAQDHGDVEVYERGHTFDRNTYEGDVSWSWNDAIRSFQEWRDAGNDPNGVLLTAEESATDGPTGDEPTTDGPTGEESANDEPTDDEPTTDGPTGDEPTTDDQPTGDEATTDGPTGDEATTDGPTGDEPTTDDQPTDGPTGDEATTDDQPTDDRPTGEELSVEDG